MGAGGINVALGPAGRAPGSVETVPPPTAVETADPVDELDEIAPADQLLEEAPEDVEEIQAAEVGETAEAEALQDVDPETPDLVTSEELGTVTAEPLEPVDDPMTEDVTSEELETIEPETTRSTDIPDAAATDPAPDASTAAITEAATPEPVDVPLTPQQDADELAALPPEPPAIDEAADVTPEQVDTRSPDPEPVLPPPRKPPPPEPTNTEPPAEEVSTKPAQLAGAGGEAGTQDDGDLGSGERASGGGAVGARADYFAVLQAWLEQHKVYPRRAMSRRLEGVVSLRFVINREGRVLDYQIERSSGHRLLDRAVTALIERAQPLPTMPNDIKETNLTLIVPISFVLN